MNSNTHSVEAPAGVSAVVAELQGLAAQDVGGLPDAASAERLLTLRGLVDRLEGHWLGGLAAGWLRARLRMGAGTAAGLVGTARARYHGPLTATAQAVAAGELSPAHAQVLAAGPHDLPAHLAAEAEPVLVAAARRLDPSRPGEWGAAPDRRGATPAAGDGGPGQPARPRWAGRGDRRARTAGPGDLPAAGLRRRRHPGASHPPPHQPEWRWRAGGAAAGGGEAAPPGPWWCPPDPAAGGGPDQPGGDRRPTRRPPGPPGPPAARRPHRRRSMASQTRVCTYDRLNVGRSDRDPGRHSGADSVADLHACWPRPGSPVRTCWSGSPLGGCWPSCTPPPIPTRSWGWSAWTAACPPTTRSTS